MLSQIRLLPKYIFRYHLISFQQSPDCSSSFTSSVRYILRSFTAIIQVRMMSLGHPSDCPCYRSQTNLTPPCRTSISLNWNLTTSSAMIPFHSNGLLTTLDVIHISSALSFTLIHCHYLSVSDIFQLSMLSIAPKSDTTLPYFRFWEVFVQSISQFNSMFAPLLLLACIAPSSIL